MNTISNENYEKGRLPTAYSQTVAVPQQSGVPPPPPLGSYDQPGPPPGMYHAQPLPGSYTGPLGGYQTGQPLSESDPSPPPLPPQQTNNFSSNAPNSVGGMQSLIPIMPMGVAVTLCVINCILPGIGTMIAGMTVCCCAEIQDTRNTSAIGLFCVNFWLGLLQLIMIFFIVGWVWSIMWGILFITLSSQFYGKSRPNTNATVIQQTTTVQLQ